jgi:hypothetical protein
MDKGTSLQGVEVLGLVQVPEHDNTVLTGGGTEGTIGGDGNSVDITVVTNKVGTELHLGKIPDLNNLVPTTGNDERVGRVGRETDTGDPFRVTIFGDVEFALTKGVPHLDALVTRTGNDLTVIGGERDGQDVVGVANETTGSVTSVQVPKTKGLIPRGGQSELTVGRDGNILNKVRVTNEGLARNTIVQLISTLSFLI